MRADVRARTQPVPRVAIVAIAGSVSSDGTRPLDASVRTENAPMRIVSLNVLLIFRNGGTTWAECEIGDPRIITLDTPATFNAPYKSQGPISEWRALITYTDLAEAFEYHTKLNDKGFAYTHAADPPGVLRTVYKKLKHSSEEIPKEEDTTP